MLDNREIAALVWVLIIVAAILAVPALGRNARYVAAPILHPKIYVPFVTLLLWVGGLVLIASRVGLWVPDLLKDTAIWLLGPAVVLFFNSADAVGQERFFSRTALATIKLGVLLAFFINFFVLPLLLELILQPLLAFLFIMSAQTTTRPQDRQVRTLVDWAIAVLGFAFLMYAGYRLSQEWRGIDPLNTARQILLPVWLTLGVLPFIYLLSLYSGYDRAFAWLRIASGDKAGRRRAKIALFAALHFRARELNAFQGGWAREAAEAPKLRAALRAVKEYRAHRADARRKKEEKKRRLDEYAGVSGTDEEGRQLDQREFQATRQALRKLASAQMGWYRNRGGRYRTDLLDILSSQFKGYGLPREHGIHLHVSEDGQAWWAWRRTITGWCFAVGAAEPPPNEFLYDGPDPPEGFPGEDDAWGKPYGTENVNW